jgi:hypothetical protein
LRTGSIASRLRHCDIADPGKIRRGIPKVVRPYLERLVGCKWVLFENYSHMPHVEEKQLCPATFTKHAVCSESQACSFVEDIDLVGVDGNFERRSVFHREFSVDNRRYLLSSKVEQDVRLCTGRLHKHRLAR